MPKCNRRPGGFAREELRSRFPGLFVCSLLVAVIAFLTYASVLGLFFDDRDSLILIETARIRSGADLLRILTTRPVYNAVVDYYRPLALLSYSLDYLVWGLNPFGYHLTDLILHVLVSLSVLWLGCSITRGDRAAALIGALLFTLHPILVEIVPSSERRHDVMAALFFLLSFLLYVKGTGRGRRTLSLLCYALSLCSKEVAIVLPLVVWAYLAFFAEGRRRIARGLRESAPLYVVTALYAAWRFLGPGARVHRTSNMAVIAGKWIITSSRYFAELLYPVDFVSLLPRAAAAVLLCAAAVIVLAIFYLSWRRSVPLLGGRGPALRVAGRSLSILSLLSLAALLTYPVTRHIISRVIESAYAGEAFPFISREMTGRGVQSVQFYLDKFNSLFLGFASFTFFASWLGFVLMANADRVREVVRGNQTARIMAFLLLWLLILFAFYLVTVRFEERYLYLPAIPFSLLLSIGLLASLRSLARGASPAKSVACFFLCAGLALSLCAYSPLLRSYGGWKGSGDVASMFLGRLLALLPDLPRDGVLTIDALPVGISSYDERIPHVKSVEYLADYSVRAWLDLNDPGNERQVVLRDRVVLQAPPRALRLEVGEDSTASDIVIRVVAESELDTD